MKAKYLVACLALIFSCSLTACSETNAVTNEETTEMSRERILDTVLGDDYITIGGEFHSTIDGVDTVTTTYMKVSDRTLWEYVNYGGQVTFSPKYDANGTQLKK